MAVVVQKYGGSSVGTTEKIKGIAQSIVKRKNEDTDLVIVVSAMGDTTDDLLSLSKGIGEKPDKRELDALLSTGEIISSALLAMAIKEVKNMNMENKPVTGIATSDEDVAVTLQRIPKDVN
ncbi:hypothetical protein KPL35_18400, partial [Clostridium sp. CF011]|nr:hypothetical protein [Clostridium sp. CF011]